MLTFLKSQTHRSIIMSNYVMLYLFLPGCKGAQVEEIWSMEPENFDNLKYVHTCSFYIFHNPSQGIIFLIFRFCFRPVHGLIFLFKWQPGEEPAGSIVQDSRLDQIFFAKQVFILCYINLIFVTQCCGVLIFES